jgi:hypothetical protein
MFLQSIAFSLYLFILNIINYICRQLWPTFKNHINEDMAHNNDNQLSLNISLVVKLREHHKKSYEIISKALQFDELVNDSKIGSFSLIIN